MRKLLQGDRGQQTGVRRGALDALTWTQIVQAVSNVWNEPWEELLPARATGARQNALFIGRIRGRLSLKELGQLAGGIHHNAVGIAIRRFQSTPPERLQSDRTLLKRSRLFKRNQSLTNNRSFVAVGSRVHHFRSRTSESRRSSCRKFPIVWSLSRILVFLSFV